MSTADDRPRRLAELLPILMLITDPLLVASRNQEEFLREAVRGGVNLIQVREAPGKPMSDSALQHFSDAANDATFGTRARFIIHSNASIAGDRDAAGLHLREADERSSQVERRKLGEKRLLSRSVHSLKAAVEAERDGTDMLVLGTVFPSSSHPGGQTIGLDSVRAVCKAVSIPVIGIGGITAQTAGDVIRAGASGVAVISAIFDAEDPRAAAAALRDAIDDAYGSSPPSLQGRGTGG